jgi:hypothetical protein
VTQGIEWWRLGWGPGEVTTKRLGIFLVGKAELVLRIKLSLIWHILLQLQSQWDGCGPYQGWLKKLRRFNRKWRKQSWHVSCLHVSEDSPYGEDALWPVDGINRETDFAFSNHYNCHMVKCDLGNVETPTHWTRVQTDMPSVRDAIKADNSLLKRTFCDDY